MAGREYNSTVNEKKPNRIVDEWNKQSTDPTIPKSEIGKGNTPSGYGKTKKGAYYLWFPDNPSFTSTKTKEKWVGDIYVICKVKSKTQVVYHIHIEKEKANDGSTKYANITGGPAASLPSWSKGVFKNQNKKAPK